MYIQFNKEKMHVQIICGTLEEYAPTQEHKDIQARVDSLRKKLIEFQKDVVGPEVKEIEALIQKVQPSPSEDKSS